MGYNLLNVIMFVVGWLVFLYLQAINSVKSSSNGLTPDWSGMKIYLKTRANQLILRAFLSAVFYPVLIQKATDTLEPMLAASGMKIYAWGFSALAGFGASGMLYQVTGLMGRFLRGKEMHEVSPPEDSNGQSGSGAGRTPTP